MLISDSPELGAQLQDLLKGAATHVLRTVKSVAEAINLLGVDFPAESAPAIDLFLADDQASGVNGIQVCLRLKSVPRLRAIPVILLTANRHAGKLQEAFDAGVADFITQPFNTTELLVRVRSVLRLKQEMDARVKREKELLKLSSNLSEINYTLSRLSSTDVLTGIANRSRLDQFLDREWKCAIRESTPISFLLIDIDRFTVFNSKLGHEQGDECFITVAGVLDLSLKRPGDLAARFNGGMLAAALTHTDSKGAATMAELLRLAVLMLAIKHPESSLSQFVTVTIGAATANPGKDDSHLSLIVAAEQALYDAKQEGRNCSRHKLIAR